MAVHRVVVLALPGVFPFELGIPARVFRAAVGRGGTPLYEVTTCSIDGRPVATNADFTIGVAHDQAALARADTVVVAPTDASAASTPADVALLDAAGAALAGLRPGVRVASICNGADVVARAGLLDGRPATTHWNHAQEFRARYPQVLLDPDVLYVDDGDVLTSAGAASGIDLCLHLVRRDHGVEVANGAARACVVPPHRDGGQAQFGLTVFVISPDSLQRHCVHRQRPDQGFHVLDVAVCRIFRTCARPQQPLRTRALRADLAES